MKKNIANIVTMTRIIGTIALVPFEPFSKWFWIFYIWCFFSDILDGFLARTLKTTSPLGAKLDSVSDLLFYSVMMLKMWKYLKMYLPRYIWIMIYLVLFLRAVAYLIVGIRDKVFESRHTIYNKLTGGLLFLLPFFVQTRYLTAYALAVLTVAFFSTIEEFVYIFKTGKAA